MLNTLQNESDCQQTQPQIINNGVYCEVSLWSREKITQNDGVFTF